MELSVIWPDFGGQRFACHGCTNCCRELVVHLTAEDRRKIDRQKWDRAIDGAPYVRFGGGTVLNHGPDGTCVFLQQDGRCRIHAEFGADEKPLACRVYPFTLDRQGDRFRAGLRFDCPSVAHDRGAPVAEHRSVLDDLAGRWQRSGAESPQGSAVPVRLTERRTLSDEELDGLVHHLDRWLRDGSISAMDRLLPIPALVGFLETPEVAEARGSDFDRLVAGLVDELPAVLKGLRDEPPGPPTRRQVKTLRRVVFAHAEHVSLERARAGWLSRLVGRGEQLRRYRRLAAGRCRGLSLAGRSAHHPVGEIEVLGPAPDLKREACDALLTRYLRIRLASHAAFGSGYYGWTLADGLRAMVLSIAAAGWLARFIAASEDRAGYTLDDVAAAVGTVDRTAGRSPVLGSTSSALQLRYVTRDGGLERLVRRFAAL